ncbi:CDP-glucose 4,6-dehydratase [Polluticoccus soli]|uniref:CDP-glucose 4,6-dehydratase n=1 Tax=Polluticoccus soli TaxID=3034150 RepID=UPI0023E2CC71|nr:CDP-glucose 4,6-dehydratase [Flavipsychrobacter sp. JY13-12]
MVNEQYLRSIFANKRVFVTGHTGFKGAWLIQILHWLGADVKGYSLAPEKTNDLYNQIDGDELCYNSIIGDLRDLHLLQGELVRFEPDFVFHLAAQSLVRRSYDQPVDTFMVNTQGTVHVLEAIRSLPKPCVALMITTDKVYENPERGLAFKEDDKLGGYDPYAASKAAAEIVIDSYRRSFFHPDNYNEHRKAIASVRAGNVIGGGDYSDDRIIPDIVRALEFDESVGVRNPNSIRPWQHVLEPLGAYLLLAARMTEQPVELSTAFNFGPNESDMLRVEELVKIFLTRFGKGTYKMAMNVKAPHEAKLLLLDSSKAHDSLGWQPKLDAQTAIEWTANWYASREDANTKCLQQIKQYFTEG